MLTIQAPQLDPTIIRPRGQQLRINLIKIDRPAPLIVFLERPLSRPSLDIPNRNYSFVVRGSQQLLEITIPDHTRDFGIALHLIDRVFNIDGSIPDRGQIVEDFYPLGDPGDRKVRISAVEFDGGDYGGYAIGFIRVVERGQGAEMSEPREIHEILPEGF